MSGAATSWAMRTIKWPLLAMLVGCGASAQPPGDAGAGSAGNGGSGAAGSSGSAGGPGGGAGAAGNAGTGGGGAGGVAGGGGSGAGGADPLNAPAKCSSGVFWTPADGDSRHMRPGESCASEAACHGAGTTGLHLDVAGTVYPTGHEPDDCHGYDPAATGADLVHVVVTDSAGMEFSMLPNDVGSVYLTASLTFPLHAKVTNSTGGERAMVAPIDDGSCNHCHTQTGDNAAPGRITIPQ